MLLNTNEDCKELFDEIFERIEEPLPVVLELVRKLLSCLKDEEYRLMKTMDDETSSALV